MSPSKVIAWDTFHNIVDGKQRGSDNIHNGIDPTTGEKLWDVPIANQKDVDDAVAAATRAFAKWSQVPFEERKAKLVKFGELCNDYKSEFTDLLCKETGKPVSWLASKHDHLTLILRLAHVCCAGSVSDEFRVQAHVTNCNHYTNAMYPVAASTPGASSTVSTISPKPCRKASDSSIATLKLPEEVLEDDEKIITTRYVPLGVVGAICPWNFPIVLSIGKIAPAVLAGDCIILKPSPYTPYTTLKEVELAQEIFPPGVVQVVGGDDKLGPMLTIHPDIAKISFTGSIATGKKIMAACAGTLKRVTLELGGNDAAIVLPDVDIEKTAPEVAMGAFFNSGQVCVATKRIYIHEKIYRPFVDAMIKFTQTIKVGSSDDEGVLLGPIQNAMQYEKVKEFFADSKSEGHNFVAGSNEVKKGSGYFIQ